MNDPLTFLGDTVDAFEDCWQRGVEPAIDDFLPADPSLRRALLARLIHIDLEYRLRKGEAVRVESYFGRYADLVSQPAIVLDLVAWEFHVRERREPEVTLTEYRRRFPHLEPELTERIHTGPVSASSALRALPPAAGRYRIEEEIARGAMGRILRVRDEDFDRPLAMKILLGHGADLERRFVREARITGLLQHPGVPPVHALGRLEDGRPYFVMKLVHGHSLQALLKNKGIRAASGADPTRRGSKSLMEEEPGGVISVGFAKAEDASASPKNPPGAVPNVDVPALVTIFKNICDTVGYAHSRGVIHRDLKPANIMVGAFGEVQVMDWGLAKMIEETDVSPAANDQETVASLQLAVSKVDETVSGSVLGTPSYMAPEQARGEVVGLDARADVFALGAILCEILTGRPVYEGDNPKDILRMAVTADLTDAMSRLAGCGADVELAVLTRRCLSDNKHDRPANGAEVAGAVAAYRAALQSRLKQAEIDRAAQQARADEEHKRLEAERGKLKAERRRRQMTVVVGVGLVMSLAAASAAVLWFQTDQIRQQSARDDRQKDLRREIKDALAEASYVQRALHKNLRDPESAQQYIGDVAKWKVFLDQARSACERAENTLQSALERQEIWQGDDLQAHCGEMDRSLKVDVDEWELAAKLDEVRLQSLALFAGTGDIRHRMNELRVDLDEFGFRVLQEEPIKVAEKIKSSNLRYVVLASLDHWAMLCHVTNDTLPGFRDQTDETRRRLFAIARQCDDDKWRSQFFRDEQVLSDPVALAEFVKTAHPESMPAGAIIAVAVHLHYSTSNDDNAFLRRAAAHHYRDFWLHLTLSALSRDVSENLGSAKTALSIRPESSAAAAFLGRAYSLQGDHDAALALLQKAVRWGPQSALAHNFLGSARRARNELPGAIEAWRKAFELDKYNAWIGYNLGKALLDDGNVQQAIFELRRALEIQPDFGFIHEQLGVALRKSGDLDGAIEHFQLAIETVPDYSARLQVQLGIALQAKKEPTIAIDLFREAIRRAPNYAPAYEALGAALVERGDAGDLQTAIALLQNAIELAPTSTGPYQKLGVALAKKQNWSGASEKLQKAVDLDPRSAEARRLLGQALLRDKQPFRAIAHFRKAIALVPKNGDAYEGLGMAHFEIGNLDDAITNLRQAVSLDPMSAAADALARSLARMKELDSSMELWKERASANPKQHEVQFEYGVALRNKHDLAGAIAQFRKSLELNPNNVSYCDALADTLYDDGQFDPAINQYGKSIDLDPGGIERRERVATLLRNINDPRAIEQYREIGQLSRINANQLRKAGHELQSLDALPEAIACYRRALALGANNSSLHMDLGAALLGIGDFTEGRNSLLRALKQLPINDKLYAEASQQLQKCDRLVALDRSLASYLKDVRKPAKAPEQLELAEFCRQYKSYHALAARLYGAALQKKFVEYRDDFERVKWDAARSALRAAAGKGLDPRQPDVAEQTQLRQQALGLLRAELGRYEKAKSGSRLAGRLEVWERLSQWRQEADLANVREPKALALLPASERATWQQFWADVERVMNWAPALVSETIIRGTLTDRARERIHDVKLSAGQICLVKQFSRAFDSEIGMLDVHDNPLIESSKLSPLPGALEMIYSSQAAAAYRIVASSVQQRRTGPYVLTIRVFDRAAK